MTFGLFWALDRACICTFNGKHCAFDGAFGSSAIVSFVSDASCLASSGNGVGGLSFDGCGFYSGVLYHAKKAISRRNADDF